MLTRPQERWFFYLGLAAFAAAVASLTSYSLWLLRSDAIHSSLSASALMARSFENFLTQSVNTTVLNAASLDDRLVVQGNASAATASLDRLLRQAPHLRSLSVIDAQDRIVLSSNPANVGSVVATQDFLPLAQSDQVILRIGKPWRARDFNEPEALPADNPGARATTSVIPITYPLEGKPDRRLLVGLNPDFFVNHMMQQIDPQTGMVEVLRMDGVLLMSTGLPSHVLATHIDNMPTLLRGGQEFGKFEHTLVNGDSTLTAFRVSSLYPLVVVSHLNRDVALAPWRHEMQTILAMVVPSALLVVLLALAYYRRQRLLKAQQAESQRLQRINAACVFDNSGEGIIITSADGTIIDVNAAFTRISGYSREEAIGHNPRMLSSGLHDKAFYQALWDELKTKGRWSGEIWNRHKNGEVYAEILTISAVSDFSGTVQQYVAVFTNITAIKTYQNELERMVRFDVLTNLPNRILLADRLQQALLQAQRRQLLVAVVFIDLDGFKAVNDTYGHQAGDVMLKTLSGRMRAALREGDTLARNGGDEFIAVLVDLPTREDTVPMLRRLLAVASEPVDFADVPLQVSASLGVSFYMPDGPLDRDALIREADAAMYHAKTSGKNRYAFYAVQGNAGEHAFD